MGLRALGASQIMIRALIVSYLFPPSGGGGVQRVLKLVKYLPEHGVQPTVLTAENPSVPVLDASLTRDLPAGVRVLHARTLEPSYELKQAAWAASSAGSGRTVARAIGTLAKHLLVPDPQVLWQPAAQCRLARRLFGPRPDDVVLVSGPPFSQFLLGLLVRLSPKTKVVLDYRDEWTTYRTTYEMKSRLAAGAGELLEPLLLRRAHAVTTATDEFRRELLARFRFLDASRVHAISNGYDPDDFPRRSLSPPSDRLVLTYAGTVFKLTSARSLVGAVRRLHEREPALTRALELHFAGRIVETEADYFEGAEAFGIRRVGYLPHERTLEVLAESHVVVCLLANVPGAERVYPAKIFELMYLGRPCLTLAPQGALASLVRRHGFGDVIPPDDEEAIARVLEEKLRAFRAGSLPRRAAAIDIERYHRRHLAGEFACLFRALRPA
jgi:glycosyltransferase involved in cell wall biosynthesis